MTGLNLIYSAKSDFPDGYMYSLLTGWRTSIGLSKDALLNQAMDRFVTRDENGNITDFNWDAITAAFGRGYDGITSPEFDVLAAIYIHIALNDPFQYENFINAMAISIGSAFNIVEPFIPNSLQTTELGVFSDDLNTIWSFDSRSTNAIRDRVETNIANLLEEEYSGGPNAGAARRNRLTLLQASGLLYAVSTLTQAPCIMNPGGEVIFGTADGPAMTVKFNLGSGCLLLGFTQSDQRLKASIDNSMNTFQDVVNAVNNVQDQTFLTNQRTREIMISTAYEGRLVANPERGEAATYLSRAIETRANANELARHEFDPTRSVFNSIVSVGIGAIPVVGDIAGVADTFIISPFVEQARINEVHESINIMTSASRLTTYAYSNRLDGVFISEDGISKPPLLWFSADDSATVDREF